MSILKSTNSGKMNEIIKELEKRYGTSSNANYEISEYKPGKYLVTLSPKNFERGCISVVGYKLKYKLAFKNNPYLNLMYFETCEDFHQLNPFFKYQVYKYDYRYCKFYGKMLKTALKDFEHIYNSALYVPSDFFDKLKGNPYYQTFLNTMKKNDNDIYIRTKEGEETDQLIDDEYEQVELAKAIESNNIYPLI